MKITTQVQEQVQEDVLSRTIERCRERNILIPTFSELRHPETIPKAVGERLQWNQPGGTVARVIGVVANVNDVALGSEAPPMFCQESTGMLRSARPERIPFE